MLGKTEAAEVAQQCETETQNLQFHGFQGPTSSHKKHRLKMSFKLRSFKYQKPSLNKLIL